MWRPRYNRNRSPDVRFIQSYRWVHCLNAIRHAQMYFPRYLSTRSRLTALHFNCISRSYGQLNGGRISVVNKRAYRFRIPETFQRISQNVLNAQCSFFLPIFLHTISIVLGQQWWWCLAFVHINATWQLYKCFVARSGANKRQCNVRSIRKWLSMPMRRQQYQPDGLHHSQTGKHF